MKYPQLVSTRAVSAISDWLVTQLEQLGVDASLVYSRLLLSLLHTPLQINALDLAELSEIKVGTSSRSKIVNGSNYRRFSAADTEALKRLAAIDSLLEAVSTDQKLSKIENLVDELSAKLREIERQNQLEDSYDNEYSDDVFEAKNSAVKSSEKDTSNQEDPAKRYYQAFPALSNDSIARSAISWPRADKQLADENDQSDDKSNNIESNLRKKSKRKRSTNISMSSQPKSTSNTNKALNARSIEKDLRGRQKNMLTKGGKKDCMDCWDTNFDGAWEMGHDLIREFIMNQNKKNIQGFENKRKIIVDGAKPVDVRQCQFDEINGKNLATSDEEEINLMKVAAACSVFIGTQFSDGGHSANASDAGMFSSISDNVSLFTADKGISPETMSCLNEMDPMAASLQRRLYEREASMESINRPNERENDESTNLAAFEAKFNRSVEALWDNEDAVDSSMNLGNNLNQLSNDMDDAKTHQFWQNYYKHQYKQNVEDPIETMMTSRMIIEPQQSIGYGPSSAHLSLPFYGQTKTNDFPSLLAGCDPLGDKNAPMRIDTVFGPNPNPSAVGGMSLTASIWSDVPHTAQDDVSFYMNSKQLENDCGPKDSQLKLNTFGTEMPEANFKLNAYEDLVQNAPSMMIDNKSSHSLGFIDSFANTKKWSENSSDIPLLPSIELSETKQDERIRRYLFENSYSIDATKMSRGKNFMVTTADRSCKIEQQSEQKNEALVEITLKNHSANSSFKAVCKSSSTLPKSQVDQMHTQMESPPQTSETENLLTSEKTHFCPIKQTYPDGFTFDISGEWDEINYERSASGTMYLESEVYREYYVYDEDGNGGRINVDAAGKSSSQSTPFVLKYCVRQNEKCIQTDVLPPKLTTLSPNVRVLNPRTHQQYRQNATSAAFVSDFEDDSMDVASRSDFLNMDDWTSTELRKKCNNNLEKVHALWEHCDACSNDVVSMPANRLLRDELSAEGDEIMSDLKYMRNLYIDSDWEGDDGDTMADGTVDDDDGLMMPSKSNGNNDDGLCHRSRLNAKEKNRNDSNGDDDDDGYSDAQMNHIYSNVNKLISDLLQPEKAMTLVQAISEKCNGQMGRSSTSETNKVDSILTKNSFGASDKNTFFGGLWDSNDNSIWRKEPLNGSRSIWSKEIVTETKADELDSKIGLSNSPNDSKMSAEQWEHANLEKIWSAEDANSNESNAYENQSNLFASSENVLQMKPFALSSSEKDTFRKLIELNQIDMQATTSSLDNQTAGPSHKHYLCKNRHDRKRRHSATSQNIYDSSIYAFAHCDTDGQQKKRIDDLCGTSSNVNDNSTSSIANYITCKYWTTDPTCFDYKENDNNNNNNDDEDNLSMHHQRYFLPLENFRLDETMRLSLHPTAILKHVAAMVARPLTR